jgi:hypothetical protein
MRSTVKSISRAAIGCFLLAGFQAAMAGGFQLGTGVGIPYGGLGVKLGYDIDLGESLTITPTAGAGTLGSVAGSNVGLQIFVGDSNRTFRPGFGVWNGTNTYVLNTYGEDWTGSGVTVGLTPRLQFGQAKQHIVDLNLLYISTSSMNCPRGYYCQTLDNNRVKLGVGYSYRF